MSVRFYSSHRSSCTQLAGAVKRHNKLDIRSVRYVCGCFMCSALYIQSSIGVSAICATHTLMHTAPQEHTLLSNVDKLHLQSPTPSPHICIHNSVNLKHFFVLRFSSIGRRKCGALSHATCPCHNSTIHILCHPLLSLYSMHRMRMCDCVRHTTIRARDMVHKRHSQSANRCEASLYKCIFIYFSHHRMGKMRFERPKDNTGCMYDVRTSYVYIIWVFD